MDRESAETVDSIVGRAYRVGYDQAIADIVDGLDVMDSDECRAAREGGLAEMRAQVGRVADGSG